MSKNKVPLSNIVNHYDCVLEEETEDTFKVTELCRKVNVESQTALPENIEVAVEYQTTTEWQSTTKGTHLRTFLKKARDWKAGWRFAQMPKIVLIGDSMTGGCWAEDFKLWLCTEYKIWTGNFDIHWYGGYAIEHMLPFVEDTLIFPNPDLIIFNEKESFTATEERKFSIENIIQLLKDRTTADIAICTWSAYDSDLEEYVVDNSTRKDNTTYQLFNWYREVAANYNCELIDFNQALYTAVDNG